jgi:putative transposase
VIENKVAFRGGSVIVAPRFYPSSKACSACGVIKKTLTLAERTFRCDDCGHECNRDLNAALNLLRLDTLRPDAKRTQEPCQPIGLAPIASVLMA